ncbi:MAG: hypothetical protein LIQ31_16310 [Planctomycetes bacterium]|nr:hypothetical protein [Planctomycetota bacterium]
MEYKIRYMKKKKANKARNRQEAGYVRVKVRGRKRWIRATPAGSEEKKEA